MKNLMLVLGIVLLFSTMAMAADIAISTDANWWSQDAADREMQEIADNVTGATVEQFASDQQDALADWVVAHTGDGVSDLLILCGKFPATIYPAGNAEPDGSIAELFLDDGNTIINTGDWMFYVGTEGNNAEGGLQNMMDIAGIAMWDDDTAVVVTAEGQEFTPSLVDLATDRPFHLDQLAGDWEAELILAQNAAGTRADPVIVRDSYTGGRLGIFHQTNSQDDDPRGEVISEWINNWYLPIGTVDLVAMRPVPKSGTVIEPTTATLEWLAGDDVVVHYVYFAESLDELSAADAVIAMQASLSTDAITGYAGGLTPGQTYYWRVDEVGADGAVYTGEVWSFMVQPLKAWNPSPANGSINLMTDTTLSWAAGTGALFHTLYIGESFDDVNDATEGGVQSPETVYVPELEEDKTYYWRVDEFSAASGIPETIKGDVWTFSMVPVVEIGDPNLVGWWTLDEGAGSTAVDWSGYANHGTLAGSPEWVDGFFGGALQFEAGDYVDCGVAAAEGVTGDFTLAAWVKLAPGTDGNYGGIAGKLTHLDTPEYRGFSLVRHSSNVFRLWIGDGTDDLGKSAVSSDELYTDTEWHHVAGMHEGQTNTLYVDGVLQAATTETGMAASPEFFHIGRQYSHLSDRYFLGLIDDVRVYDEVLTVEELAEVIVGDSLFFDRFDTYEVGSDLHGQGGWKGWDNTASAGAPVTDANSPVGANTVEILGSADLVQEFDIAGGVVEFSVMQYIPSGTTGTTYFILLNSYDDGANQDWSIQTTFNLDAGTIGYWHGGDATIVYDEWVKLRYVIDLGNNTVDKYYNGEFIVTDQWDDNDHGTLGAVDLFGNGASSVYYDDVVITPVPEPALACYTYDGDALDETWDHDNGSDAFDGTAIGEGMPGGAMALIEEDVTFLRVQDPGDPRDYGFSDPTNRKVYLTQQLTDGGLDGAYMEFRIRVATGAPLDDQHPDGGAGIAPWPEGGIGYHIRDGGKGMIGLAEGGGTDNPMQISFSLVKAGEPGFEDMPSDLLVMNGLGGTEANEDTVDSDDEGAIANILPIADATAWNTVVVDIAAGGTGTHIVTVSVNGDPAASFDVTAGDRTDEDGDYLAIGSSGTGAITAFDVDYVLVCK